MARHERKLWLLRTFDPDLGPLLCRCAEPTCQRVLTYDTLTVERRVPGALGGTYARSNIEPLCRSCNQRRGIRLQQRLRVLRGEPT